MQLSMNSQIQAAYLNSRGYLSEEEWKELVALEYAITHYPFMEEYARRYEELLQMKDTPLMEF